MSSQAFGQFLARQSALRPENKRGIIQPYPASQAEVDAYYAGNAPAALRRPANQRKYARSLANQFVQSGFACRDPRTGLPLNADDSACTTNPLCTTVETGPFAGKCRLIGGGPFQRGGRSPVARRFKKEKNFTDEACYALGGTPYAYGDTIACRGQTGTGGRATSKLRRQSANVTSGVSREAARAAVASRRAFSAPIGTVAAGGAGAANAYDMDMYDAGYGYASSPRARSPRSRAYSPRSRVSQYDGGY